MEEKLADAQEDTRTPVKERIRRINKAAGSPGKFPGHQQQQRQQRIVEYYARKSPKAMEARGKKGTKEGEAESYTNQGASNSPLLGDADHTGTQSKTSKGPVPDPEARGTTGNRKKGKEL